MDYEFSHIFQKASGEKTYQISSMSQARSVEDRGYRVTLAGEVVSLFFIFLYGMHSRKTTLSPIIMVQWKTAIFER